MKYLLVFLAFSLLFSVGYAQEKRIDQFRNGDRESLMAWYEKEGPDVHVEVELDDYCGDLKKVHPVVLAAFLEKTDLLKAFVQRLPEKNKAELLGQALAASIHTGNANVIAYLIEQQAPHGKRCALCYNRTDLMIAAATGQVDYFNRAYSDSLLEGEDCLGYSLVHLAAAGGAVPIMEKVLNSGRFNVDEPSPTKMTPLMFATHAGKLDMVRYLVDAGAGVENMDAEGVGMISWAVASGNAAMLAYWKEQSPDWKTWMIEKPGDLPSHKNVHSVYFAPGAWDALADGIFYDYPFIHDIDVDGNEHRQIPSSVTSLEFLKVFYGVLVGFEDITPLLAVPSLEVLELDEGQVRTFEVVQKSPLQRLNLRYQQLQDIPAGINLLTNLRYLNLEGNALRHFPSELSGLQKLEELSLAECGLKELPKALYDLKALQKLDVSGNAIPEEELDALEEQLPDCNVIR